MLLGISLYHTWLDIQCVHEKHTCAVGALTLSLSVKATSMLLVYGEQLHTPQPYTVCAQWRQPRLHCVQCTYVHKYSIIMGSTNMGIIKLFCIWMLQGAAWGASGKEGVRCLCTNGRYHSPSTKEFTGRLQGELQAVDISKWHPGTFPPSCAINSSQESKQTITLSWNHLEEVNRLVDRTGGQDMESDTKCNYVIY